MTFGVLGRLAAAVFAAVAGFESVAIADRAIGADALLTPANVAKLLAGWTLVLCGLAALTRRRSLALLLITAGFAWFIADWRDSAAGSAVVFTLGLLLATTYPVLIAHAALRNATTKLAITEHAALAAAYVSSVLVAGLLPTALFDPRAGSCFECPSNLLRLGSSPSLVDALSRAGVSVGAGWTTLLIAVLSVRLVRCARPLRATMALVSVPAVVCLAAVLAEYAQSIGRGYLINDSLDRRLLFVQAVALTAVGLGTLWPEVQRRIVRARVTNLVIEAAAAPAPGRLAETLGALIGDPAMRVLYPLSDGRVVDATGAQAGPGPRERSTPLVRGDRVVGILVHRPGVLDAESAPAEIARCASLALENERLQAEARARLAELRLSRARIVETADAERKRLERDMHDGAQQKLVALGMSLRLATLRADGSDPALEFALAEVTATLADLRRLARGIYPRELADEGLAAALETFAESAPERVELRTVPDMRLDPRVESAAYFTVAFLTRSGTTPASVSVRRADGRVHVDVETPVGPFDLTGLEDRVRAMDGTISVDRLRVGVELPCVS